MIRKLLVGVGIGAALCGSSVLWLISPRLSALVLFVVLLLAVVSYSWIRRKTVVFGIWGLCALAVLLPIDIAFGPQPGFSPRLVRALYGLPGPEALALAANGEVWLGGCVIHWNSPKWMLLL